MTDIDSITGAVLDLSIRLHRELGPGLLESAYETVLAGQLMRSGYRVERQRPIGIDFEGLRVACAFRIDVLVEDKLIIEVKSVETASPMHAKQLLTYLRLSRRPVGLLINFGRPTLREGFRRIVNDYRAGDEPA